MSDDTKIRKMWGSGEDYSKWLNDFTMGHRDADRIVVSAEHNCPIRAEYDFKPYLIYRERQELMERLRLQEESES